MAIGKVEIERVVPVEATAEFATVAIPMDDAKLLSFNFGRTTVNVWLKGPGTIERISDSAGNTWTRVDNWQDQQAVIDVAKQIAGIRLQGLLAEALNAALEKLYPGITK